MRGSFDIKTFNLTYLPFHLLVLFIVENASYIQTFEPEVLLTCSSAIERVHIQFSQNIIHIEEDLRL